MAAAAAATSLLLRRHCNTQAPHLLRLRAAISSSRALPQQLELSPDPTAAAPLPPNPSTGSPFYGENWRNPAASNPPSSLLPAVVGPLGGHHRMAAYSATLDAAGLKETFAEWMAEQRWEDMKQLFEFWVRSLDAATGKPNRPDVDLFNHYLRANLMAGALPHELLDLADHMREFEIEPNTASHNLVLKSMVAAQEAEGAEKLIERMLQTGTLPDDESYNLVVGLLIRQNRVDSALKYLDLMLKSGYTISLTVFTDYVRACVRSGRLDTLASVIEKCKTTDKNKVLCPQWAWCIDIAEAAFEANNSKLALFALEFLARWIARGENVKPSVQLSVNEGLVISALSAAGRTYNTDLLNAAWSLLRKSLRQKRAPTPETYLAKIYAHSSIGQLQRAFGTLRELENAYGNSEDIDLELFSPFTSLHPLVVACCKDGFTTLDSVYVQLENLSRADPPYKSVAAVNCVILGCANIWDLDRAYETFEAIKEKFELTPDIHSYNALLYAFGKMRKTEEACNVLQHLLGIGVKPNATTYSLLVNAHLVNKNPKAALAIIDGMVDAGFTPSKETLKKVRRRCSRESDFDSDEKVQSLSKQFNYRMGGENRRELLYNIVHNAEY
ncbi:pentatricopeptide repeat-containing protein At1g26460, mitochondrial-like [Phragmites australis]|uniref:pentatricopeptide repeat-containing protein At1g26460, mitochondrial-like n=1 Tax=Phragmites australis TaxID=29695 RepID=UPI002D7A2F9D|nr:pentatricopeptide repeat-containing protein At1g26460, mitochondrial-like [Phragmites australis]XP_062187452.1 pentatricopeptide repeat-containing protein At1g26460, mitochondrial-like [Phragmites australis]